jgi:hypothetical protein
MGIDLPNLRKVTIDAGLFDPKKRKDDTGEMKPSLPDSADLEQTFL